jgi:Putative zinc-finger
VTTCDEVRPTLPDHALGSLDPVDELAVDRHLRGCVACRRELEALRQGIGVFASALARTPPQEVHDRVFDALTAEWADLRPAPPAPSTGGGSWARLAVAASVIVALVAGALAFAQAGRAERAEEEAKSYRTVLATLGGTGFRVGRVEPAGSTPVEGSVVAYESSHDQSFVVVFLRTPAVRGAGSLLVTRSDGTTWSPGPIEFDERGDAALWWVSDRSIATISGVSVRAPDGSPLATATLRDA